MKSGQLCILYVDAVEVQYIAQCTAHSYTVLPHSCTVTSTQLQNCEVVQLLSHSCCTEPSVPSVEVTQTRLPRPNGSVSGMIMKPRPKLSSLSAVSSFVNHLKDLNQQMCLIV